MTEYIPPGLYRAVFCLPSNPTKPGEPLVLCNQRVTKGSKGAYFTNRHSSFMMVP